MRVQQRLARGPRLLVGLVILALAACGPTNGDSGGGGGGGGQKDGGNPWGSADGPASYWDGQEPDYVPDANSTCATSTTKAQLLPLDIYIMMDQSGSMADPVSGGTKWTAIGSALDAFLQQPLTGVSVGIQFFPLQGSGSICNVSSCTSDANCTGNCGQCIADPYGGGSICYAYMSTDSCTAADYASPAVAIQPLPGVHQAIKNAFLAHSPNNLTPTSAALQGAVNYAKSWAGYHPGDVTIVIFATDGDPTECDVNMAHIDAIAAGAAGGTPKILTFVIGVGSSLSNLNGIAQSGGTTAPFLVDTGGNVTQQMLQALNSIRGAALACTYTLPTSDGGVVDPTKVNVQYTPGGGGAAETIPQAPDKAHCPASGDAWYYDNPTSPTQIILCPATCTKVTPDATGEVDIQLGCQTTTIS